MSDNALDAKGLVVAPITDDNRGSFRGLALAGYIGLACTECQHVFESADDLEKRDPVRSRMEPFGLACKECWDARQTN